MGSAGENEHHTVVIDAAFCVVGFTTANDNHRGSTAQHRPLYNDVLRRLLFNEAACYSLTTTLQILHRLLEYAQARLASPDPLRLPVKKRSMPDVGNVAPRPCKS